MNFSSKMFAAMSVASMAMLLSACEKKSESVEVMAATAKPAGLSDQQIADAYLYLLGRELVLRQQRLDFENGFKWNEIINRKPGGVDWVNPNLDVVYSEAWVAVDEKTCVELEIPKIEGRYYTWHMLNGWGETVLNINERTYPQKPYGKYALCLKGSTAAVPEGLLRIDLPSKTTRVLARIEQGANSREAVRLQSQFRLKALGEPVIDPVIEVPLFSNDKLPRVESFDVADAILKGEADINPGMDAVRKLVVETAALAKSGAAGAERVSQVISGQAIPSMMRLLHDTPAKHNGWSHPATFGNYGNDYKSRTFVNFGGLWANNTSEAIYFGNNGIDGGSIYLQTFPADALPKDKTRYFWSVIVVDSKDFRVIPNSLNRFLLNKQSPLQYNKDGSLTIAYGPRQPKDVPQSNWLPTPDGSKYNLTFRLYGPSEDASAGKYFPPELVKQP